MDLQNAREQIFAVPLERFVETRAELAAELAREGKKDDSKKLKAVRRPSLSAWATNQVVRQALSDVTAFLEASDHLRRVQREMLSGQGERAAYQAAAETFRDATNALGAAIRATLTSGGRGAEPALVERVISNVRLAASDDRRNQLLGGQLETDIAAGDDDLVSAFGASPGGAVAPSPSTKAKVDADTPVKAVSQEGTRQERLEQARRAREEQMRAQEEEQRRRLQNALDEEAAATQRAKDAEAAAQQASTARDQARERLDEADRVATQARQAWREAETFAHRAEREALDAKSKVESATQRRKTVELGRVIK